MKRIAKRSPQGSSPSGGSRLRLTILLATVAAFLLVPAAQAFASPGNLTVHIEGTGAGEVTSVNGAEEALGEPAFIGTPPIECEYESGFSAEGTCNDTMSEEFNAEFGETYSGVWLTAIPAPGSEFVGWTVEESEYAYCGNLDFCFSYYEGGGPGDSVVTATFTSTGPAGPPLTLKIEEGQGTVVSNPAGLECTGAAPHECKTESIAEGTVTLTASPAAGYQFKSWKYCDSGGVHGRQCTITLTENHKPVGAKFAAANDVTVEKAGNGTGSITGVTCGNTCTAATGSILATKTVTLKAKPYAKNSEFIGWNASPVSCATPEPTTCSLGTLSANETVEAEFAEQARENLTVAKSGHGQGSVKSAPAGINCSYTCGSNTAYFYQGTSVTLTAAVQVGKGSELGNWSGGGCSGSEAVPCVVTMSAAKSVTAEFK